MNEAKRRFAGKLGMCEMEEAAGRIVYIIERENRNAGINDMANDTERIGYVELMSHGWMYPGRHNGEFFLVVKFFKRLGVNYPDWYSRKRIWE